MIYKKNNKLSAGFTMLYASLIGSLVLTIGLAILNVTVKQITLASAARESAKAFYAADTGMECALYLNSGSSNTACPSGIFPKYEDRSDTNLNFCGSNYKCNGATVHLDQADFHTDSQDDKDALFSTIYVDSGGICFKAVIAKKSDNTNHIESHGYNNCSFNTGSGGLTTRFERQIDSDF